MRDVTAIVKMLGQGLNHFLGIIERAVAQHR